MIMVTIKVERNVDHKYNIEILLDYGKNNIGFNKN